MDPARGRTSGIGPPKSRPEPVDGGREDGRPHGDDNGVPSAPDKGGSEEWILESVELEAEGAVRRGRRPTGGGRQRSKSHASGATSERPAGGDGPSEDLFAGVSSAQRAKLLQDRLRDASKAFGRDRFGDALKILRPLIREAPGVAEVRELAGLSYYRLGRWRDAAKELTAFVEITGSTEQHPVLADCARAQGRYRDAEEYWDLLRRASPSADLVAEGRIVMAGVLADQGRLDDAVALMEQGRRKVKRPKERHLRMAYVLADLQERAGDLPAARSGFRWLASHDPEFADVGDRLAALH